MRKLHASGEGLSVSIGAFAHAGAALERSNVDQLKAALNVNLCMLTFGASYKPSDA